MTSTIWIDKWLADRKGKSMSEVYARLAPLQNGTGSSYTYLVPMEIDGSTYKIYVGGGGPVRMFDKDSLPGFIKAKLAMISVTDPSYSSKHSIFTNTYGPDYKDIGWRTNEKDLYIIVMTVEQLGELRGTL